MFCSLAYDFDNFQDGKCDVFFNNKRIGQIRYDLLESLSEEEMQHRFEEAGIDWHKYEHKERKHKLSLDHD